MSSGDSWEDFMRRPSWQGQVASCLHGGPNPSQLGSFQTYMFASAMALSDFYGKVDRGVFTGADIASKELDVLVNVWSDPMASRTIQKNSYKAPFSMAVDAVYDRDFNVARQLVRVGCFLREWGKIGKETFLRDLKSRDQASCDSMNEFGSTLWKTRTDRGVTLYLAAQIPCTCLKAAAEAAAEDAHMGKCESCQVQKPRTELKRCAACNLSQYCSRECQKADWKEHKKVCPGKKISKHKTESG